MTKLRIFIDLDGVLADFGMAAALHPDRNNKGFRPDLQLNFADFNPIPGSIDAVQALLDAGHEVLIASTAPWDHPDAWTQKRMWVGKHFPQLKKKLILTHRKDLLMGDILIDDNLWNGAKDFNGTHIHFGQNGMDWKYVVQTIDNITNLLKIK